MKRRSRLSGALKVKTWASQACVKAFGGRKSERYGRRGGYGDQIEACIKAVNGTTDLIVGGKADYFSDAVEIQSKECLKIRDQAEQIACITGATEVLLRSKGQTASLDGRKRKRRRK